MTEHRIISLIASATEIVHALGFENQLVGRSHECDYPLSVLELPACSEAKLDASVSSLEIDQQVKDILQSAVSVYRVFSDELERLKPTVIITQTQCEVCAVSLKDVEKAVWSLTSSHPDLVALEPMCLSDIWGDIRRVAKALQADETGEQLISNLQKQLEEMRDRTQEISNRPSLFCMEWIEPVMSAGNWVPELVEIAGGNNLFGVIGKHSPWIEWDEILEADPDVIAIMPCGFDINRTISEMQPLLENRDWKKLSAVQNNQVYLTDGNQFFNRPGPRVVESTEILCEILHPDHFDFGHAGTGWINLSDSGLE